MNKGKQSEHNSSISLSDEFKQQSIATAQVVAAEDKKLLITDGITDAMLTISRQVTLQSDEIELHPIRAQGAGGQHINKVSTAIHLRFDINASSLPLAYKERLLELNDERISNEGVIVIKAQRYRSQEKNRDDALARLQTLIRSITVTPKKRKPTKPTRNSQKRRVDSKTKRGQLKALRGKIEH